MKKLVVILVCTLILLAIQEVASESGTVDITVLNPPYWVNITSPLNTTYTTTSLYLNVTSNFTADAYWYKLIRINNNEIINSSVIFTPNTTLVGVSGSNNLTVYANDSYNRIFKDEVIFYVNVPNSAPQIKNLANEIFVCEDSSLSGNVYFNATDTDGDNVTVTFNQTDIFFLVVPASKIPPVQVELASTRTMTKTDAGTHRRKVSVTDTSSLAATQQTNITVIEINHAPTVSPIPVHTIYLNNTQNNTFYYEVQIADTDHGNRTSGNFSFNITFLNTNQIFNISQNGIMNFTPNITHAGTYNISINVTDNGLKNPHVQIAAQCGQTGLNMSSNVTFQLTISDQSTAPFFKSHYPTSLTHTAPGTPAVYFNISTKDNETTLPDAYWYVDGVFKELDQLSNVNEFSHDFGCGIAGTYTIKVEITDGIFNDSLQWTVSVTSVTCPAVSPGGGGGGGSSGATTKFSCQEKWGCYDWKNCQSAERTFLIGLLDEFEYNEIKTTCENNKWDEDICGFQLRDCFDVNKCNSVLNRPTQIQECFFTANPNCKDRIKNCHDGSCELLIDCGGPCEPCPTCTDQIQNQGEEDKDCGGPCSILCSPEKPLIEKPGIKFTLYIILAISVILAILKFIKVLQIKKNLNKKSLKIIFFLISIIFLITLTTAQCFPEYQCGDWSNCTSGFQTRICVDKICSSQDLIERTTCIALVNIPEERQTGTTWTFVEETNQIQCKPQIQCNQWTDCTYTEKITNILKEKINYGGHRERICEDLANCIPIFTEVGRCGESSPVTLEKVYDGNQSFLLLSNQVSKQPVAKINLDSWESKKLDIILTQEKLTKSSLCFDGIKNNGEEKTDCGGECKPCEKTKIQLPLTKIIVASWIFAFIFFLIFLVKTFPIKRIHFKLRQLNFNT